MVIGGKPEGAHRAMLDLHGLAHRETNGGAHLGLDPDLAVIQRKYIFAARRLLQNRNFSGQRLVLALGLAVGSRLRAISTVMPN